MAMSEQLLSSTNDSKQPIRANADNANFSKPVRRPTSKQSSKQLNYYLKNKEAINKKRRANYQHKKLNTHKTTDLKSNNQNKQNKKEIEKPNDIKISDNGFLEVVNQALDIREDSEKKQILSLFDLCTYAINTLSSRNRSVFQECDNVHAYTPKTAYFFVLPDIVYYVGHNKEASFYELADYFKKYVSKRQLKRAMQLLVNYKWLIRFARADLTVYRPNPFLEMLTGIANSDCYLFLGQYAKMKIDFFDLLNIPLLNAVNSGQKIIDAKVHFREHQPNRSFVKAFFIGFIQIELKAENGEIFETYLPVNRHAASKIIGYDKIKKKPITANRFYHHTIPLKWSLFNVLQSVELTKRGRKSRWEKNPCQYTYVHFDNSFKIICYDKRSEFGKNQYLRFGRPFERLLKNIWSKKTESCQYIEVSDFETLQKLFTYRFVDGKKRFELFDSLGMTYAPIERKPKGNKNSTKKAFTAPKPIDLMAMLAKEKTQGN
jgi:hypothetical protein